MESKQLEHILQEKAAKGSDPIYHLDGCLHPFAAAAGKTSIQYSDYTWGFSFIFHRRLCPTDPAYSLDQDAGYFAVPLDRLADHTGFHPSVQLPGHHFSKPTS